MSIITINKYIGGLFEPDAGGTSQMCEIIPPQSSTMDGNQVSNGYYSIVVDNSGSMNSPAKVVNDDGDNVNHGWSILDIAKHSLNTFIQTLDKQDWVYISSYSDSAVEVVGWTPCTEEGKVALQEKLYTIQPHRATNMVAGLAKGFEAFEKISGELDVDMSYHLLFTTDGMPSSHFLPPRGISSFKPHVTTLLNAQRRAGRDINVITVGLGNDLNSTLLTDICAGTGEFLHLPDPGCVGPFMVNLVAQCRTICKLPVPAVNMYLRISPEVCVVGYEDITEYLNGDSFIPLKHILWDSPRHIVAHSGDNLQFGIYKKDINSRFIRVDCEVTPEPLENKCLVTLHHLRQMVVKNIMSNITCESWREEIKVSLDSVIRQLDGELMYNPLGASMKNTLVNELLLGLSNEGEYRRWGRHYMRTLIPHLRRELRTNFRDEIMQSFPLDSKGGEGIFERECNNAELIFASIQPPEPSLLCSVTRSLSSTHSPISLPDEFMRGGGCFHPQNTVERWTGQFWETIPITHVTPHDQLKTPTGNPAEVKCIIKIPCTHRKAQFSKIGDLTITPWHPIRIRDGDKEKWVFPMEYSKEDPVVLNCSWVYNLVMHNTHIVEVSGYSAVTLGHGFKDDGVVDNFWGRKVIDVLKEKHGWLVGYVILKEPLNSTMSNISRRSRRKRKNNSMFVLNKTIKKIHLAIQSVP